MPGNEPLNSANLKNPSNREQAIEAYLSYQDTAPDFYKATALRNTLETPAAHRYAEALLDLFSRNGERAVVERALGIVRDCSEVLTALEIEPSCWARSISFAMWDMAKQQHYFTHPGEADSKYPPRDPMTNEALRAEIVNRHVGWEAFDAFASGSFTREQMERLVPIRSHRAVIDLLSTPPKPENNTLSSWQLSDLGAFMRP